MDRRRNNGPEVSVRPLWPAGSDPTLLGQGALLADGKPQPVIDSDGGRLDGRYAEETRPLLLLPHAVPRAAASVYAEQDATCLVVSVYGPRAGVGAARAPAGPRSAWASVGQLSAEVNWAPSATPGARGTHAPGPSEYDAAEALLQALVPAVRLDAIPGAYVDIYVTVLSRDGSDLALAITAASAALILAGIEMHDSVVGVSLAYLTSPGNAFPPTLVVDPTALESGSLSSPLVAPFDSSNILVAVLPNRGGLLSQLLVCGRVPSLEDVTAYAVDAARAVYQGAVLPLLDA